MDGDGRVDLAIAAVSGGVHVMNNVTASRGHALEILPVAGADKRTVLGTKVVVTAGGVRQVQEFILRPSYASGAWVPLHFGLGTATAAKVEVVPPGRTAISSVFDDVSGRSALHAPRREARREKKISQEERQQEASLSCQTAGRFCRNASMPSFASSISMLHAIVSLVRPYASASGRSIWS